MAELVAVATGVLLVLGAAVLVRVVATTVHEVVYPVLLVVIGVAFSVLGVGPDFRLSSELILVVLVPTILFQAAQRMESRVFLHVLPVALLIPIVGLPIAIGLLGALGTVVFQLPLVVTLLFAVIIYPVDPVAIVAVFREANAAERLVAIAEAESHLSDGFTVVVFGAILGVVSSSFATDRSLSELLVPADLLDIAIDVTVASAGGIIVGLLAGGLAVEFLRAIEDRMAELLVTVILAYGSFVVADHYLHVSGVLATVGAGLVFGLYGKGRGIAPENVTFVERTWDTAAFFVFTLVLVLVGFQAPWRRLLQQFPLVVAATLLVLLTRAVIVYTITNLVTRVGVDPVPFHFQHVLVWCGMHTVIPIALLLSIPRTLPFRDDLVVLVFGVAILSIVGQGLFFPLTLRLTGATDEVAEVSSTEVE